MPGTARICAAFALLKESVMRHRHCALLLVAAGLAASIAPAASAPDLDGLTARQAAADICAGMNPVPVDAAALHGILEAAA